MKGEKMELINVLSFGGGLLMVIWMIFKGKKNSFRQWVGICSIVTIFISYLSILVTIDPNRETYPFMLNHLYLTIMIFLIFLVLWLVAGFLMVYEKQNKAINFLVTFCTIILFNVSGNSTGNLMDTSRIQMLAGLVLMFIYPFIIFLDGLIYWPRKNKQQKVK